VINDNFIKKIEKYDVGKFLEIHTGFSGFKL